MPVQRMSGNLLNLCHFITIIKIENKHFQMNQNQKIDV